MEAKNSHVKKLPLSFDMLAQLLTVKGKRVYTDGLPDDMKIIGFEAEPSYQTNGLTRIVLIVESPSFANLESDYAIGSIGYQL